MISATRLLMAGLARRLDTNQMEISPTTGQGARKRTSMLPVVFAGSIGTVIEWYDFLIYGNI
jgi:hypothetical protein